MGCTIRMTARDLKSNRKHWGWTFRSNIQVIFQSLNIDEERSKKTKPRKIMERKKTKKIPKSQQQINQLLKLQKLIITTSSRAGTLCTFLLYFTDARRLLVQRMYQKQCLHFFQWKPARKENRKIHACIYNRLWWAWNKNSKSRNLHILQEWSFHSLPQVKHTIPKRFFSWEKVSNQEWKQTG